MGAKKRQTMGKIIRERERAEKRARKQEKKDEKKAAALAEHEPETVGEPGDDETAGVPLSPTPDAVDSDGVEPREPIR
jgi:hypothetical protein